MAALARGSLAHAPGGVDHRTIDIYIYIYIYLTSDRSQDHILTEGLAVLAPMTLMERQAIEMEKGRGAANELRSSFAEYRTEAGDREVRYTRQISNLKTQISTLEGKMNEMTAEAEKSEHRLSTALAKLKQQSQTPKSQKASDTPTPGVHSAPTGNPKRRDMIEKLPEAVVDAKQRTDGIRHDPLQLPGQTGDEAYARKCAKN